MSPQATANLLPGASPWKELALAGIQDANRCGRDVSMNANAAKNVLAKMNSKDKAAFSVVARAAEEQVKKSFGTLSPLPLQSQKFSLQSRPSIHHLMVTCTSISSPLR